VSNATVVGPVVGTPARESGSIRRTQTIDGLRPEGIHGPVFLSGAARDLFTTHLGQAETVAESAFSMRILSDDGYVIEQLSTEPRLAESVSLVGISARKGLRARLRATPDQDTQAGRMLITMLDDIPITAGLSRLSTIHRDATNVRVIIGSRPPSDMSWAPEKRGHPVDLCAGWTADSVMRAAVESGLAPLLHDGVPAPPIIDNNDDLAWHQLADIPPDGYRRWRRIDVGRDRLQRGLVTLSSFFRDSYFDASGAELIEHEYTIDASIEVATLTIVACQAQARVLPSTDCRNAAPSAATVVGKTLEAAALMARRELIGAKACTHLSDTLFNLSGAEDLITTLLNSHVQTHAD
jgi:hypothetical protein